MLHGGNSQLFFCMCFAGDTKKYFWKWASDIFPGHPVSAVRIYDWYNCKSGRKRGRHCQISYVLSGITVKETEKRYTVDMDASFINGPEDKVRYSHARIQCSIKKRKAVVNCLIWPRRVLWFGLGMFCDDALPRCLSGVYDWWCLPVWSS